ncbi:MAG: hypothetical protein CM15mP22_8210 [Gammaproteobacteria bacterium]|nr:MAG: hypothetical protein CM15mP22_8210 [Gammaproteobacteria bacterium]
MMATFAEIEGVPTIDEDNNTADITFVFNPKKRITQEELYSMVITLLLMKF